MRRGARSPQVTRRERLDVGAGVAIVDTGSMGIELRSRGGVRASINITPLVDVVLVMLIIFMVVVPATTVQIPVDVPPAAPPGAVPDERPVIVRIEPDLSVVIDDHGEQIQVRAVDLAVALRPRVVRTGAASTVFVDVAAEVAWRDAIGVMDTIRGLGGEARTVSVALVVDAER